MPRHVALALFLAGASVAGSAQSAPRTGSDLFHTYCASCHGSSARGDGPAADAMRVRPPNLTQLASRNGGVFPAARTQRIVDGRDVGAHGTADMPVWGDAFKRHDGLDEAGVKARIETILRYLESIQERTGH